MSLLLILILIKLHKREIQLNKRRIDTQSHHQEKTQVNMPTPNLNWIVLTEHKIPCTQNRNGYIILNLCSLAERKEHASSKETPPTSHPMYQFLEENSQWGKRSVVRDLKHNVINDHLKFIHAVDNYQTGGWILDIQIRENSNRYDACPHWVYNQERETY